MKIVYYIIVAIAAIAGTIIAWKGLRTWREQLRGNTEYELARRLLKSSYKVRDAISSVRFWMIGPSEIEHALKESGASDEDLRKHSYSIDTNRAVYSQRWKKIDEALSDLKIALLEAEVLWKEVKETVQPLYDCVATLRYELGKFLRQDDPKRPKLKLEELDKINKIIYEKSDDPEKDEFTKEIHNAINKVQDFVIPKLK